MFFATLIWGSVPLFSIWASLPSPIFVFFRVIFAFPFIVLYCIKKISIRELVNTKHFLPLLLSGIVLALNWIFFFWALEIADVALVVVLYYSGPVYTILLSIIFLKERLTKLIITALMLAFIGILFTFAFGSNVSTSPLGLIVAFSSGILYGLLGFVSKIATLYHSPEKITAYQILISIFFTLPFVFFIPFHLNSIVLIILITTAVVHTALALFLWYDSLNYIKISTASIFSYLDPFFAIILGFIFLGQVPSIYQIFGGVLIFTAGVIISIQEIQS